MPQRSPLAGNTKYRAEQTVKQAAARPWVERLARFGYAAKGAVYIVVGLLAAMAAFGMGGKTTDTRGALATIVTQPFGRVLLGAVAVGLVGYALWRFVQAGVDAENKGSRSNGFRGCHRPLLKTKELTHHKFRGERIDSNQKAQFPRILR